MPELAGVMAGLTCLGVAENDHLGIRIFADGGVAMAQEASIFERCKQEAERLGLHLSKPPTCLSLTDLADFKEPASLSFQGSLAQLEVFYFGLPKTLRAAKLQVERAKNKDSAALSIELRFASDEEGDWIGPLYISLCDPCSTTPACVYKPPNHHGKASVYEQAAPCEAKDPNCSPSLFRLGLARTQYSLPLNVSLSSIKLQLGEWPSLSREWLLEARIKPLDHSAANLKFNHRSARSMPNAPGTITFASPQGGLFSASPQTFKAYSHDSATRVSPPQVHPPLALPSERGYVAVSLGNSHWRKYGVRELCNLFTNYGNIEMAISCNGGENLLLCYYSKLGAEFAVSCLNGACLAGDCLSTATISLDHLQSYLADRNFTYFAPRKRFSSKGSGLPNRVNPLSRTLHVTYHHDRDDRQLSDHEIGLVMTQLGEVLRIKRESAPKKRNMWFVEFTDVETAVRVLMKYHNKLVLAGTLRISFTKTL